MMKNWNERSVTHTPGTSTEKIASTLDAAIPYPGPSLGNTAALPWCKCGVCLIMPQEIENGHCEQQRCTTHSRFSKLCLDPNVLQLALRNREDIRNGSGHNSTYTFRKAAYRYCVLVWYGHLGKGNREVCPSCMVTVMMSLLSIVNKCLIGFRVS